MTDRRRLLQAMLAALSLAVPEAHARQSDLQRLFALFAAQGERRKSFVERHYSVLFRNPPELRGTLTFRPPDLLEREVVAPRKESVRIDGEDATLRSVGEDGKASQRTISLARYPQLAGLVLTMRATLAGDLPGLQRTYSVELKQPLPRWRIELTPLEEPAAGGVLAITMSGEAGEVERIEFTETTGDRTEIVLSAVR